MTEYSGDCVLERKFVFEEVDYRVEAFILFVAL
jgi:hypothetical protein